MKVRTHSIPAQGGLDVDFLVSPDEITGGQLNKADEKFNLPAECHAHLEMPDDDVFIHMEAKTTLECFCYRCGESFLNPIHVKTFLTCAPRAKPEKRGKFGKVEPEKEQDSDEGLIYFEHNELNLSEIAREQILLALPMRYLCKEDCKGI